MNKFKIILTAVLVIAFSTISFSQQSKSVIHKGKVLEVLQVSSYTYLYLNENNIKKWVAAPKLDAKVGDEYFYKGGLEMPDFRSDELNRTFNFVLFLNLISKDKANLITKPKGGKSSHVETINPNDKLNIKIEPINGGVSIADLLKNKTFYKNNLVRIKAKVTKFKGGVLGKNWIHLQDGTEFKGEFDLTITTNAEVNVGDIITIEGKVTLNKDFGAGYFYKVIIENASLVKIGKDQLNFDKNILNQRSTTVKNLKAKKKKSKKLDIKIATVQGGITIADLIKNKEAYKNKTIKIRGQVTKFSPKIMGKNWIHLQDGTEFNGEFKLICTSNAEVKVGDIITLEGKVSVDRDFGYGYKYKLLIENAILKK